MSIVSAYFQDVLENKMADDSSWFYRGEGNDTLVVGLREYNLVLRLKKKLRQTMDESQATTIDKLNLKETDKLLDFSRHVFLPLVGGKYVPCGETVRLPTDFARMLDKVCESSRPKHRIHKGIDTKAPIFAVLMPDLCFLPGDVNLELSPGTFEESFAKNTENSKPTFSVEIKAKCGFLPTSPYIKEANSVKHRVCHYCMLQGVKVSEGKYPRQSQYCPVNFLSGDPSRVFHALKSLVSDPQNNLRVFKDGFPIFTDEIVQEAKGSDKEVCCSGYVLEKALEDSSWDRTVPVEYSHKCGTLGPYSLGFLQTILQIFIDDSKSESNCEYDATKSQICMGNGNNTSTDELERLQGVGAFGCDGVLQRLRQVQKMDDVDVEGLQSLYFKVKDFFMANESAREKCTVDGPYNSKLWKAISSHVESKNLVDKPLEHCSIQDIIVKLCQFSVASTAKDCSIMLVFQGCSSPPKHLPYIQTDGCLDESIAYNINLVDLDPKEFDRVVKYYKDSCSTVQHYLKCNDSKQIQGIS